VGGHHLHRDLHRWNSGLAVLSPDLGCRLRIGGITLPPLASPKRQPSPTPVRPSRLPGPRSDHHTARMTPSNPGSCAEFRARFHSHPALVERARTSKPAGQRVYRNR
jgi:hypothetical protein